MTHSAQWIVHSAALHGKNRYMDFYCDFVMSDTVENLNVMVSAVTLFQIHVNGTIIGRGPAASYQTRYYYQSIIIPEELLHKGNNRIAVTVQHDGEDTATTQGFEYGKPGFILWSDSHPHIVPPTGNSSWKVRMSPRFSGESQVSNWGFYKEFYHGDLDDDWMLAEASPEVNDSFQSPLVIAEAESEDFVQKLVPLRLPELEQTLINPEKVVSVQENYGTIDGPKQDLPGPYKHGEFSFSPQRMGCMPEITLDFGCMVVGYPEIEVTGAFAIYELWYGESLDTYRYDVVRNNSTGTWKAFQRRAFRYLKIRFIAMDAPVNLKRVSVLNTWYAYPETAAIETSSERINELFNVSLHTLKMNTSYHYEDCPWREQALWVFDLRVMARINYQFYGDTALVRKNILQMFALQRENGSIPATGPKENNCNTLDFMYHLIATVREYIEYSGDGSIAAELWPAIQKLYMFSTRFVGENGLARHWGVEGWGVFLDWSDRLYKAGNSVVLNALYARFLQDMAWFAGINGASADDYLELHDKLLSTVGDLLWNHSEQLFVDSYENGAQRPEISFQGNFAAIYAGFVTGEQARGIYQKITANPQQFPPPFGPSFYQIIFDAMELMGNAGEILPMIESYWGGMLDREVTTWWEVFDPSSPQWSHPHPFLGNVPTYEMDWIPVSTCHGWSGAPAYAIASMIFGVDVSRLGRGEVRLSPHYVPNIGDVDYRLSVNNQLLHLHYTDTGSDWDVEIRSCPDKIHILAER